jgi:hypothetical protein
MYCATAIQPSAKIAGINDYASKFKWVIFFAQNSIKNYICSPFGQKLTIDSI